MAHRFLVLVGIAAMDGLLCAFVAVLAIAFMMQGQNDQIGDYSETGMVLIDMHKHSESVGKEVTNTAVGLRVKNVSSPNCDWFKHSEAVPERCQVSVHWNDCQSIETYCSGQLVVEGIRRGDVFDFRLITLGPLDISADRPESVQLRPKFFYDSLGSGKGLGSRELRANDSYGVVLRLSVSPSGQPVVRWLNRQGA